MSYDEDNDNYENNPDLENLFNDIRNSTPEYPPEQKTARKGEFIAEIHGMKTRRRFKFTLTTAIILWILICAGILLLYYLSGINF